MTTLLRSLTPLVLVAGVLGATTACAGGPADVEAAPAGTGTGRGGTTVAVDLKEWTVEPEADEVEPGPVTFRVRNLGARTHELVLFRSDLPVDRLPRDEDGAIDERAAGVELVDEVEDVGPGQSASFSADVARGSYYLVCNLVDPDTGEQHVAHRMYHPLTVR